MKENDASPKENENQEDPGLYPDDSLNSIPVEHLEEPEIFSISKRESSVNRIDFMKTAANLTGLTVLGAILNSCEESELSVAKSGENCTCHAVCTCDSECPNDCSCDSECSCEGHSSGTYYYYSSYWYPC